MIGQGSPSSTAPALARAKPASWVALRTRVFGLAQAVAIGLWLCPAQQTACQEPASNQVAQSAAEIRDESHETHVDRIRITWGGGQPSRWHGQVAIDEGSLVDLRIAGLNPDSRGSMWLEEGRLQIASLNPRIIEDIEISANGSQQAKLIFELSADVNEPPLRAQVALSDALGTGVLLKLDDRGNTLKVERARGNELNLRMGGRPMIFFPGEPLTFELRPTLAEAVPGSTLDIETRLLRPRGQEVLWRADQRLDVPVEGRPALTITVPLPEAEGVYEVRVAASRPPGFGKRFLPGAATRLAEQSFQVVVLGAKSLDTEETPSWESVLEIDPASPRWWDRLPNWTQLRKIPGLNRGPLGSIRAGAVEHPLGRFVELPPTAPGGEPHWQAYSLPLEAVGVPHVLEIEYPADQEQQLGISIVDPNSTGVVEPVSRDTGYYVDGLGRSETHERTTHRVVFWPRTQAPLLLLTNEHPTAAARFGQIRVLKRRGTQLAPSKRQAPAGDRLVAAYISRPLLVESFGASNKQPMDNAFNLPFGATRDDWQAHYDAASRLADYLQYAGYNSAVINVLGGGRSLYPSDRSTSASSLAAVDQESRPMESSFEADGLELLLHLFDREQLSLVPAVRFDSPLPELEKLRHGGDPQSSGLEWVGPDGRTWLVTYGATQGSAPYYNVLDPRVQNAMINVVSELVDQYGHHPSLAGIAVQLSSQGYAQLPPPEWGLDDATFARFERDAGIQIAATGPSRFAARYAAVDGNPPGPHAEAWHAWRTGQLTQFYQRLAGIIGNDHERRLILTSEESLDHAQWVDRIQPNILAGNRVQTALRDAGIESQLRDAIPGIVFCGTNYVGPTVPLRDRAIDMEINAALVGRSEASDFGGDRGGLVYHRARRRLLTSFAAKSPFRYASELMLMSQPLAHGAAARKAYATALADQDITILLDGGELLPLGQEDILRTTRLILQRLPVAAQVTQINKQPILVRTYSEPTGVTLLVVNSSPWKAKAQVLLNLPRAVNAQPLAGGSDGHSVPDTAFAAGRQPWSLTLEPYGVQAVRLAVSGVQVADLKVEVSDEAHRELAGRIAELSERDTGPHLYPALLNPSFEPVGGTDGVPGWGLIGDAGTASAELDATAPHDGQTAAYFDGRSRFAVLESDSFPIPPTGQFAMTVYMRRAEAAAKTELRIAIEADHPGRRYRRAVAIGGAQPAAYALSDQWRPYPLLVNDLPLDSQGQMRIRFEMIGPGEVWLDEIKTYDLLFPLPFYMYRKTEMLQLVKLIDAAQNSHVEGKITDCVRVLEGYWPRFLVAYTPPRQTPIVNQPASQNQKPLPTASQPQQKPAPSFGEKFKWLPKFR